MKQKLHYRSVLDAVRSHRQVILFVLLGFVAGFVWLAVMRFALVRPDETHYHANFAVYLNGQRETFNEFTYYEEVAACSSAYDTNPKGRTHLHDNKNDVIHVHDKRVTYGHFFQNIGWTVGDGFVADRNTLYEANEDTVVTYILNGEELDNIANRPIGSTDRLLVSVGSADTDFAAQYQTVASTAAEVNGRPDPASCGGLNGAGADDFVSRLKRATFWQ